MEKEIAPIIAAIISQIRDSKRPIAERLAAAQELIQLDPVRTETADAIQKQIGPQSPVGLSTGLVQLLSNSKTADLAERYLRINQNATPEIRQSLVRTMLSRPKLTEALLTAMESGDIQINDLTIEQRGSLSANPAIAIRRRSRDVFRKGGVVVNNDRTKLVAAKMPLANKAGDPELGKAVFTKNCATCHIFKGEGQVVGPNLNGMSVHPKAELLTHILDPNRSVEANYRLYSVLTVDGVVISGLLSAESLTTIEMVDAQGKRHTVLREDIDELRPSKKSAMPEGFEQSIDDARLTNLLEYLTQADQFIPLGLEQVANTNSTEGMFYDRNNDRERLVLPKWGIQAFSDVPFQLIDPATNNDQNAVMLHGPNGPFAPKMPKRIEVRCRPAAKYVHVLGGVAGWAAQRPGNQGVSMIVQLVYADGQTEDHPLISGQHIADYIGRFDVPQSSFAVSTLDGGQLRSLTITPKRDEVIDTISLIKPNHRSAPIVMALTVERATSH